jgi:hypothetical protein
MRWNFISECRIQTNLSLKLRVFCGFGEFAESNPRDKRKIQNNGKER